LYFWATGNNRFQHEPKFHKNVNEFFDNLLNSPGFYTADGVVQEIKGLLTEFSAVGTIDYWLGKQTNVGIRRNLNEDSLLAIEISRILQSKNQPFGVFVVADGMGGHSAGEIASGSIVNTITDTAFNDLSNEYPETDDKYIAWLQDLISKANKDVWELAKFQGIDMGSTLVMAVLSGSKAFIANVGDSRAYLINNHGIQQITTDHSLVERLVATNQISREEARNHPQRNVIYRTIGDKPEVEIDTFIQQLHIGDRILLCSDGLSGMVNDEYIYSIVMQASSPQLACDNLIEAANNAGGADNITAIIIEIILN
jgi:protein phosphatase